VFMFFSPKTNMNSRREHDDGRLFHTRVSWIYSIFFFFLSGFND
jgi:hypothetical protein